MRVEANAVERLGLLAQAVRMGIGKDVKAVQPVDRAALAARVAGQPWGAVRVNIARDHGVARREAWPRSGFTLDVERPPGVERGGSRGRAGERRSDGSLRARVEERNPRLQLRLGQHALLQKEKIGRASCRER